MDKNTQETQRARIKRKVYVHDSHYVLMKMCSNPKYHEALKQCQLMSRGQDKTLPRISIHSAFRTCGKFLDGIEAITLVTPTEVLRRIERNLPKKKLSHMSTFLWEDYKDRLQAFEKLSAVGNLFPKQKSHSGDSLITHNFL